MRHFPLEAAPRSPAPPHRITLACGAITLNVVSHHPRLLHRPGPRLPDGTQDPFMPAPGALRTALAKRPQVFGIPNPRAPGRRPAAADPSAAHGRSPYWHDQEQHRTAARPGH